METQIGQFDIYNIYDECGADDRRRLAESRAGADSQDVHSSVQPRKTFAEVRAALSASVVTVETADSFRVSAGYSQALNDYSCGAETAMDAWLAEPSVVAALHVIANTPGMQYKKTATDLRPLYAELINKVRPPLPPTPYPHRPSPIAHRPSVDTSPPLSFPSTNRNPPFN